MSQIDLNVGCLGLLVGADGGDRTHDLHLGKVTHYYHSATPACLEYTTLSLAMS